MASNFAADLLVGGLSAAVSKLAGAPFNRGKMLLQMQGELVRQGRLSARPFTGLWSALSHVVVTEGPLGLVRGTLWDVLNYFPTRTMSFALHDTISSKFPVHRRRDGFGKSLINSMVSGGLLGAASLLVTCPIQLIHTVQAAGVLGRNDTDSFLSGADVISETVKHSGISGLYSGFGVSVAGIVVYRAVYFSLNDSLKRMMPASEVSSIIWSFIVSWSVTIVANVLTYPFDTIRRRMMTAAPTPQAYSGTLDCALTIWHEEGIPGFFHGALSNILRTIVGSMALVVWDRLQQIPILFAPNGSSNTAPHANRR